MKPIRILLVDDEAPTRISLATWLERCGFAVVAVDGPSPADRALGRDAFDLILSDVMMPGNTRLEWIERRLSSRSLPPVLLMTGSPEFATALRAANLSVSGYLLKPLDYTAVRSQIERLAAEHRQRTELLALSHEMLRLLALRIGAVPDPSDPFAAQLHRFACELSAIAQHHPRESNAPFPSLQWRDAVLGAIQVIENTRDDFRPDDLRTLHRRLLQLVAAEPTLPQPLLPSSLMGPADYSQN